MQIPLDGPLDLRRTVMAMTGWGSVTWFRCDDGEAWYAERTKDGPATLRVRHRQDHVEVDAWGPGADRLVPRAAEIVGLHRPGVEAVTPHHAVVAEVQKKLRGLRWCRTGRVYPLTIGAAVAQLVTVANAMPAGRALAWKWGEAAPGPHPNLRLLPTPKTLANTPYYAFHPLNLERHRADLLRRIASHAHALEKAADMPGPQAITHLRKLRGIGPWTAGIVVGVALGDLEVVPIGDYHLKNIVAWNLDREPRATDERMMELLEPYRGERGAVARMLGMGGASAPKWGAKQRAREIRHL